MKIQITLDIEPAEIPLANEIIATLRYEAAAHRFMSAALCLVHTANERGDNACTFELASRWITVWNTQCHVHEVLQSRSCRLLPLLLSKSELLVESLRIAAGRSPPM